MKFFNVDEFLCECDHEPIVYPIQEVPKGPSYVPTHSQPLVSEVALFILNQEAPEFIYVNGDLFLLGQ